MVLSAAALTTIIGEVAPGAELDYTEITTDASITATTEATADTVVTAGAVVFDGSTTVMVEFSTSRGRPEPVAGALLTVVLYDGATSLGEFGYIRSAAAQNQLLPMRLARRLTPSAASHTFSVRAFVSTGTGILKAGPGGVGLIVPAFIRITKV